MAYKPGTGSDVNPGLHGGLQNIIKKLSDAKVINTAVPLQATLDIVSSSADDGIDIWCGTIRRPWAVFKTPTDVEGTLIQIAQAVTTMRQQAGASQATG